jgi:hypothetical protein
VWAFCGPMVRSVPSPGLRSASLLVCSLLISGRPIGPYVWIFRHRRPVSPRRVLACFQLKCPDLFWRLSWFRSNPGNSSALILRGLNPDQRPQLPAMRQANDAEFCHPAHERRGRIADLPLRQVLRGDSEDTGSKRVGTRRFSSPGYSPIRYSLEGCLDDIHHRLRLCPGVGG